MNTVMSGVFLGLFCFGILLVIMRILRGYMNIADIIGGQIIGFFRFLFYKTKKK